MLLWTILFWVPWLLAGWLLWFRLEPASAGVALLLLTLLEGLFPVPLLRPRARDAAGRLLEWMGVLAAAILGGGLGVAAAWSTLVFRGGFETMITALGGLIGSLAVGWVYAAAVRKQETIARNETLTGLLFGIFSLSLSIIAIAWLSGVTTVPEWLFRFPRNEEVRALWSGASDLAILLVLWTAGTTFVAEAVRNRPVRRYRHV